MSTITVADPIYQVGDRIEIDPPRSKWRRFWGWLVRRIWKNYKCYLVTRVDADGYTLTFKRKESCHVSQDSYSLDYWDTGVIAIL